MLVIFIGSFKTNCEWLLCMLAAFVLVVCIFAQPSASYFYWFTVFMAVV